MRGKESELRATVTDMMLGFHWTSRKIRGLAVIVAERHLGQHSKSLGRAAALTVCCIAPEMIMVL